MKGWKEASTERGPTWTLDLGEYGLLRVVRDETGWMRTFEDKWGGPGWYVEVRSDGAFALKEQFGLDSGDLKEILRRAAARASGWLTAERDYVTKALGVLESVLDDLSQTPPRSRVKETGPRDAAHVFRGPAGSRSQGDRADE